MPRSLTALVQAAVAAQSYGFDVLIESREIGLALSWFYDGDGFEHRLLAIDPVEVGVPPGGGVGFVSEFSCTIAEDGTGQSVLNLVEAHPLYGAALTVKLLFTGEAYADAIPIFAGHIVAWEVWDGEGTLTATDERLTRNILLPKLLVTRATHPQCPEESVGQAVPLVYGAGNTLAPIPLLLVDATQSIYQVSAHDNGRMIPVFGAWPPGSDRLKSVTATASQAEILGTNRLRLLQRLTETKLGVHTAPPVIFDTTGVIVTPEHLLDDLASTVAVLTTQAGTGLGQIRLDYTHPDPVGINTIDITLKNHRRSDLAAVTVHGDFILDSIRQDGTTAIQGLFASLERRVATTPQTEQFRISGVSLEAGHTLRMTVRATNETGTAGGATDSYEVGQILVEASYLVSGPFEHIYLPDIATGAGGVFEPGVFEQGVFDASVATTFQARTDDASGTLTGVPGAVLENPVDVLGSIVLFELGLPLNAATQSAARTARQTWKMAGGIGFGWFRGRTGALDLLHSLCLQAGCYLYPTGDGTFTTKPLAPLDVAAWSLGPAGSATDYLLYAAQDPSTPAATWRRTLRYRGGRNEQIRNTFEIRYAYHAARQQFSKLALAGWAGTSDPAEYLSPAVQEMLDLSRTRYGEREAYQLDADFLYDDATAFTLLDLLIPYWTLPRQEIEFETTMAPLPVLLGETIAVDTQGMPASMRGQVFEVDRLRYDFAQGRIFLHATARQQFLLEYFRMRDQTGTIWYLWIDGQSEQLVQDLSPPAFAHTTTQDITPETIPYWLTLVDPLGITRYLLPDPLGQMLVQASVPPVGTGYTGSPVWQAQAGHYYAVAVTEFEQYLVTEVPAP